MTALEKAARALAEGHGYDWELCPEVTRNALKAEARAVLMAVRDLETVRDVLTPVTSGPGSMDDWPAMIDAILNEEPK